MLSYYPITKADLPQITSLYSTYLTAGQSLTDGTYAVWEKGGCFGTKVVDDDGNIAGFFSVRPGLELTYPHPDIEREVREVVAGRKLYTVDGMLVLSKYREHGLARELIAETLPELRKHAELVLIEIWIYPNGSSPGKLPQETLGEIIYSKKVPMFYKDLLSYRMRCPICGVNCVCGAYIELAKIK